MISRYNQKDIEKIWSLKEKYKYFLKIEKAICHILGKNKIIPSEINEELKNIGIDLDKILMIEKNVKHDLIAFTMSIEEQLSFKFKSFFHYGVTSSDIIDTALMLQIKDSVAILKSEATKLLLEIKNQIHKTSNFFCCGRTHGIYAEPMVFAQKWLSFYVELKRRIKEIEGIEFTGQVSGAIGTNSFINQDLESDILNELKLKAEPLSTQVIPRDRILSIVTKVISFGTFFERIATEFRHLQHSDVGEVYEGFGVDQKGSSIMPHKKNPISFENITGISRVISSYYNIAYSNCALWHERDLSHSSSERIYLPDLFNLVCYGLRKLKVTIENLNYDIKKIESKLENKNLYSSLILHEAISYSDKSRDEIYKVVQQSFFQLNTLENIIQQIEMSLDINLNFSIKKVKEKCLVNFKNKYKSIL